MRFSQPSKRIDVSICKSRNFWKPDNWGTLKMRFESHLNVFWDLGVVQMAKCSDLGARELGNLQNGFFSHSPLSTLGNLADV